MSLPQISYVAV